MKSISAFATCLLFLAFSATLLGAPKAQAQQDQCFPDRFQCQFPPSGPSATCVCNGVTLTTRTLVQVVSTSTVYLPSTIPITTTVVALQSTLVCNPSYVFTSTITNTASLTSYTTLSLATLPNQPPVLVSGTLSLLYTSISVVYVTQTVPTNAPTATITVPTIITQYITVTSATTTTAPPTSPTGTASRAFFKRDSAPVDGAKDGNGEEPLKKKFVRLFGVH
ncbi:hypothetical protein DFJ74DRAFT_705390 [Hyaloraphidium curvatum]|nr:hypothetical protein DFJ74DRAFT_705390 [Hyaloraphidium curvatum]